MGVYTQIVMEELYLDVFKWGDTACYRMAKPKFLPKNLKIFKVNSRLDEVAVIQPNGSLRFMTVGKRCEELIQNDVIVEENDFFYGKRCLLAKVLKKTSYVDKELERCKRVRELFRLDILSFEQAKERIVPVIELEKIEEFLKVD